MTEDAPQEPPALDHDDDPNTQVGDFTTPDVDLTGLLGDDDPYEDELPAHIAESEQDPEYAALAEQGRRSASERDDLIAAGVDPAELAIPIHPADPEEDL